MSTEIFNGLTEAEETRRGELLADVLNLKPHKKFTPPRYETKWGTKTALGLFRTIERIVKNGE